MQKVYYQVSNAVVTSLKLIIGVVENWINEEPKIQKHEFTNNYLIIATLIHIYNMCG